MGWGIIRDLLGVLGGRPPDFGVEGVGQTAITGRARCFSQHRSRKDWYRVGGRRRATPRTAQQWLCGAWQVSQSFDFGVDYRPFFEL